MGEIIPFDFEEHAVRVIMRDTVPWFVAADICRVLEHSNPSMAISSLDEDERAKHSLGRQGETNIISESGLYALVLTSRKETARRFRKWVTAEVLPAIRKTGRYEHGSLPQPESEAVTGLGNCAVRDAELWLSMIREARLLAGTKVGRAMWARSPLPPLGQHFCSAAPPDTAARSACLQTLCATTIQGQTLPSLASRAAEGDTAAADKLTRLGLRALPAGLFIGNLTAEHIFAGTPWAAGLWRALLATCDGAETYSGVLSIGGTSTRGLVLPYACLQAATMGASQ